MSTDHGASQGRNQVGETLAPLVEALLAGPLPVRFEFWDGSGLGPGNGPGTVWFRSPEALRHIVWSPGELGMGRAFVSGMIDIEGDLFDVLRSLERVRRRGLRSGLGAGVPAVRSARKLGLASARPVVPPQEAHLRGRAHSKQRDAEAISHHYDVGNAFYRLVLGPSMTYSCARFAEPTMNLEKAQASKHELICNKLGLGDMPGMRLLDIGCGWGSMALHAAQHHDVHVLAITISRTQADAARKRVADAGLTDRVEIVIQDYRDLRGESFDAISSIGMFEHVGKARIAEYFETLHALLRPQGRLLNHAISTPHGSKLGRRSFVYRYVFPDGELIDVGDVVLAMERAGFEVRDVESLREHYARTLRCWVANLEANWEQAVAEADTARARIWRLYMAGSAVGFEDGGLGIHQVLGVVPDAAGSSGMPPTRRGWD